MKSAVIFGGLLLNLSAWAAPNLDQEVSFTAKKVSALQAIKSLSKKSGVELKVNPKVQAKKTISIDVADARLRDVLDFLAVELRAKWTLGEGNSVQFSSIE